MKNYLVEKEDFESNSNFIIENNRLIDTTTFKSNLNYHHFQVFNSKKHKNIKMIFTNDNLISLSHLDIIAPNKELLIFLSRHVSKSETPTLTSHFTGNFSNDNSIGGKPYEIANTYPSFQKKYMKNLYRLTQDESYYDIMIEASHHGPTSSMNPILFIEIGSTEKEWNKGQTAASVCKCLLNTIYDTTEKEDKKIKTAIGIGGNHYPQKFNHLIINSDVAFGTISSKYNLKFLNEELLKQMKTKSIEKINYAYIDEKGLGKEKKKILSLLESEDLDTILI